MSNISIRKRRLKLLSLAGNTLSDIFFIKLKEIAVKYGMNPADLLLVMYSESGVNPSAINPDGGATGIGQFMPFVLKGLGWTGTHQEFSKLEAEDQLEYMDKLIQSNMKVNGGNSFESAARYYQSHFLPATLSRGSSFDTIIADGRPGMAKANWEKSAYDHNTTFDQDKKGYITIGDLDSWLNKKKKESKFQELLARLNAAPSEISDDQVENKKVDNKIEEDDKSSSASNLEKSLDKLDSYLDSALANANNIIIKKALYKKHLPENKILIHIEGSDLPYSFEFARVFSSAINEELESSTSIYSNGSNIEILCTIHGDKTLCIEAIQELNNKVHNIFYNQTKKIASCNINTSISFNNPSYKPISYDEAVRNYRRFRLKFLG